MFPVGDVRDGHLSLPVDADPADQRRYSPGAADGVKFYLVPDFNKIREIQVNISLWDTRRYR